MKMIAKFDLLVLICAVLLTSLQHARCLNQNEVNLTVPVSSYINTNPDGSSPTSTTEPIKQRILKFQSASPPPVTPMPLTSQIIHNPELSTSPNSLLTVSPTGNPCFMTCDLPVGSGPVSQYINPASLPMERIVVYMYAVPEEGTTNKKYYLYVPGLDKQSAMPELPLHTNDVISEVTMVDVPAFMAGSSVVVKQPSFPARPVYVPSPPLQPAPYPIVPAPAPQGVYVPEKPASGFSVPKVQPSIPITTLPIQDPQYPSPADMRIPSLPESNIIQLPTPQPMPGPYLGPGLYPGSRPFPDRGTYPGSGPHPGRGPYLGAGQYPGTGSYPGTGQYPGVVSYPGIGPYAGSGPRPGPLMPSGTYPVSKAQILGPYPGFGPHPKQGPYLVPGSGPVPLPGQGTYPLNVPYPYPTPTQMFPSSQPDTPGATNMVMVYFPGDDSIPAGYYLIPEDKALWPPGYRPGQKVTEQLSYSTPASPTPIENGMWPKPRPPTGDFGDMHLPKDYVTLENWVIEYIKSLNNPKIDVSKLENQPITLDVIKGLFPLPPGVDESSLKVIPILISTTPLQEYDLPLLINNKHFIESFPFVEALVVITSGVPPAVVGIVPIGVIYPDSQIQLPRPPVQPLQSNPMPSNLGPINGFNNMIVSSIMNTQQPQTTSPSTPNILGKKPVLGNPFIQQANNDLSGLLQLQPGEFPTNQATYAVPQIPGISFSSIPGQSQKSSHVSTLFSQTPQLKQQAPLTQQIPFNPEQMQPQVIPMGGYGGQKVIGSYSQPQMSAAYQSLFGQMPPQTVGSSVMETRMLKGKGKGGGQPSNPRPEVDPQYRIIGGRPATGSGAPLSNKGRSGTI